MGKYVAEIEGNEFYARDLIAALKDEGLTAYVQQTGGGTATFYAESDPEHEVFAIGPGSFNWTDPATSVFTTDELYYGLDWWTRDDEERDFEPDSWPVAPGTSMQDAARQIAAKYREIA